VRNRTLHQILEAFTAEAAGRLTFETAHGAEIPFELVQSDARPRRRAALYCYRPLTGAFIRERLGLLIALPTYAPAARALSLQPGIESYLRQRGEARIPSEARERADAALRCLLARVFAERSEFAFSKPRFETAYCELEHALYEGRAVNTVIAPLLGIGLDRASAELALGDGLSLVRGDSIPDAPAEAVWADGDQATVLVVLVVTQGRSVRPPLSIARARFRRLLTALRLFERGGYALGPLAWTRIDDGEWRPVALTASGRPRSLTLISAEHEDELRGFCNLVARRRPPTGEVAWALARYEMGCERLAPFEALSDYLLALRALLEPEGPDSGHLARRLAALCGTPEDRVALAERAARAISLERAVVVGVAPDTDGADALVDELAEHLRALLCDVICGHLDKDLCAVAERLSTEAAAAAR